MTPWIPRGWPNEELGPVKSYTFTMKATVSFDAGDEVIMSIAGHVSRAMLSRYYPVRMEAKRQALDEIATPSVQPTSRLGGLRMGYVPAVGLRPLPKERTSLSACVYGIMCLFGPYGKAAYLPIAVSFPNRWLGSPEQTEKEKARMNANHLGRAVSLLIVMPVVLIAQLAQNRDPVMLKHWSAPLYWQPAQATAEERFVAA